MGSKVWSIDEICSCWLWTTFLENPRVDIWAAGLPKYCSRSEILQVTSPKWAHSFAFDRFCSNWCHGESWHLVPYYITVPELQKHTVCNGLCLNKFERIYMKTWLGQGGTIPPYGWPKYKQLWWKVWEMVVVGGQLDWVILEISSNFVDSMILIKLQKNSYFNLLP